MKSVVRSASRLALAAVVLAAAPVLAQDSPDQPAGPGAAPADPGATPAGGATPAKAERKVDPKAQAAWDAYRKMLATPAALGAKTCAARVEIALPGVPGGEPLVLKPDWTRGEDLKCEIELPESLAANIPPEMMDQVKGQISSQVRPFVEPFFDDMYSELENYNLEWREEGDKKTVILTPFKDDAKAERSKVSFGTDGLATRMVNTPKVDPDDPNAAMMAGADIEVDIKHEKRGERYVVSGLDVTLPIGQISVVAAFFDGPDGIALAKELTVTMPGGPEPMSIRFFDYVLDGKAVEGTAKPKPAAAAPPAPAEPEKGPEAGPGPGATPEPGADK